MKSSTLLAGERQLNPLFREMMKKKKQQQKKSYPKLTEIYSFSEPLEEAAANVNTLLSADAAVYVGKSSGKIFVYNWKKALVTLESFLKKGADKLATSTFLSQNLNANAFAFIELGSKYKSEIDGNQKKQVEIQSVARSAARKGFGPVVYDIALAKAYPAWVTPDQFSLSSKAKKVWEYMFHQRAGEIEHTPIPYYVNQVIEGRAVVNDADPYGNDYQKAMYELRELEFVIFRPNWKQDKEASELAELKKRFKELQASILEMLKSIPERNMYRLRGANVSSGLDALKANHEKFLVEAEKLKKKYYRSSKDNFPDLLTVLESSGFNFFHSKYSSV